MTADRPYALRDPATPHKRPPIVDYQQYNQSCAHSFPSLDNPWHHGCEAIKHMLLDSFDRASFRLCMPVSDVREGSAAG